MINLNKTKTILSTAYDGYMRKLYLVNCAYCTKEVYRPKSQLRDKNYCSITCRGLAWRTRVRVQLVCSFCKKEFERTICQSTYTKRSIYFCSKVCQDGFVTLPKPPCLGCGKPVTCTTGKYCSRKCQGNFQYTSYIERWLKGEETGNSGGEAISPYVRRYFFEKHDSKCSKCSWMEVHPITKKVPLTLNHIDGNYQNSVFKNLELLCPNCHSLTPNYGCLNKGRGRRKRLLKLKART